MKRTIIILLSVLFICSVSACGSAEDEPVAVDRDVLNEPEEQLSVEAPDYDIETIIYDDLSDEDLDIDILIARHNDRKAQLRQAKGIIADRTSGNNPKYSLASNGTALAVYSENSIPGILRDVNSHLGFSDDLMREFQRTSVLDGIQTDSTNAFTVTWWTVVSGKNVIYQFLYEIN